MLVANNSQGNCKFGAKCALGHYMPDGHRVNKADLQPINGPSSRKYPDNQAYRAMEQNYHDPYMMTSANAGYYPDMSFFEDELDPNPDRYAPAFRNGNAYDHPVGSPPTSQFGSPSNDVHSPPTRKWASALDAPMPASYTGSIPNYAKVGHVSGSVPDKFGLGSPPLSMFSQSLGSPPIKDNVIRPPSNLKSSAIGSSLAHTESIGERILHSQAYALKSRLPISSSVPVRDLDAKFAMDDLAALPSGIQDEVLTTSEKMKLASKPDLEPGIGFKDNSEGLAIPRRGSNTLGSPPTIAAGSPSRFRALFEEQQRGKSSAANIGVGSPLRESWMLDGDSAFYNRPPVTMSGISAALSRVELNRTESTESNNLRPSIRNSYARQMSSPGLSGKRIDEEGDPATFFPMDDEGTRKTPLVPFQWGDKLSSNSNVHISRNNQGGANGGFSNGNRPIFGGFGE